MTGYIYKITNKTNNKFYIGQTSKTVEQRWSRHVYEAMTHRIDTAFSRAIRKYGKDAFELSILEEVEYTDSQQLTDREYFWITETQALKIGYNSTLSKSKCGGNTYAGRTPEANLITRKKLSAKKVGENNPNAVALKLKNVDTNEELHFGSAHDACDYFNEANHSTFTNRYNHKVKSLYKGSWQVARETEDYLTDYTRRAKHARAVRFKITDLVTGEFYYFDSYVECERVLGIERHVIPSIIYRTKSQKGKYKHYIFELV